MLSWFRRRSKPYARKTVESKLNEWGLSKEYREVSTRFSSIVEPTIDTFLYPYTASREHRLVPHHLRLSSTVITIQPFTAGEGSILTTNVLTRIVEEDLKKAYVVEEFITRTVLGGSIFTFLIEKTNLALLFYACRYRAWRTLFTALQGGHGLFDVLRRKLYIYFDEKSSIITIKIYAPIDIYTTYDVGAIIYELFFRINHAHAVVRETP